MNGYTNDSCHIIGDGDYFAIVTLNGCSSDTSNIINVITVGYAKNQDKDHKIIIYPNPNHGSFILHFVNLKKNINVIIYNTIGEKIFQNKYFINVSGERQINLEKFPPGIYIITICGNSFKVTKKIVLN